MEQLGFWHDLKDGTTQLDYEDNDFFLYSHLPHIY